MTGKTFSTQYGVKVHRLAREAPSRFGTRYVALCGASAYDVHVFAPSGRLTCQRCKAKEEAAAA